MRPLAAVLLCVFLLPSSLLAQASGLHVDEAQMRAHPHAQQMELTVPIDAPRDESAVLRVEFIDPDGKLLSDAEERVALATGRNTKTISVAIGNLTDVTRLRWARVRYTVSAGSDSQGGTLALGAIQPDLFEMRVAYPRKAKPGQPYRLRVQTTNPVTRTHTAGVSISARMLVSDEDKPQIVRATTDNSGGATLIFKMPAQPQDEASIEVNANLGEQKQSESLSIQFDDGWQVLTSTDKELYQPGQALHARALCLGPDKHALAKQDLRFTLEDPEDNVVLRDTAKTNEFGIAHVDWSLPESLRLGDYRLRVDAGTASDDDDNQAQTTSVRISRYDLPNFSVSAEPDRGYYLPGQNATVKIAALYLFGKPVLHGKVRVVRENERHWDFKTQKWDLDEEDETLGALDDKGNYELKIDLASQFGELDSDSYKRYQDLKYAAYITDETTGKTEQKRFAVRLSRDRVHVYLSGETYAGGDASFYVVTYFPDGSPAKCDVQLSEIGEDGKVSAAPPRLFSTNKYGVAKIRNMHLQSRQEHSFKFVLIDPSGAWTTHMEDVWFGYPGQDDVAVAVDTDHALYKPGDPIYASIRTPKRVSALTLDVMQNDTVLRTMSVRVRNGHADVTIPYEATFKGELTIAAYDLSDRGEDRWRITYGTHTVMFPEDRTLRVEAQVSKASYRPGEDADITLRVEDKDGKPAQSALGAVVFDKAVEERMHTDQDFGQRGRYGFWDWGWIYEPASYGGISRLDLVNYNVENGIPLDYDTVADVLLNSTSSYSIPEFAGGDYALSIDAAFRPAMEASLKDLDAWVRASKTFPRDTKQLEEAAAANGGKLSAVLDPWGQPFHYRFDIQYSDWTVTPVSAGPDKKFGTPDDMEGGAIQRGFFSPYADRLRAALSAAQYARALKPVDSATLQRILAAHGFDFAQVVDPWGQPYDVKINVSGTNYNIAVLSKGPKTKRYDSTITAWSGTVDYFGEDFQMIDKALAKARESGKPFPRGDKEFDEMLSSSSVSRDSLRDPWSRPYRVTFRDWSEYSDSTRISGSVPGVERSSTPVTVHLAGIVIMSDGPDGQPGTYDDISVTQFISMIDQQSGRDLEPTKIAGVELSPYSGAILGTVTDQAGAVIQGAIITANRVNEDVKFTATTDANGKFLLKNLPSGLYRVVVSARGFTPWERSYVPVRSSSGTQLEAMLRVGSMSETVEVSADASQLMTTSAGIAAKAERQSTGSATLQNFTPRLREYFPETLLWEPSVITRPNGTGKLHFKLADNITTWKLSLLASDKDGRVGYLQKELRAFQPFFLEHEPPKVLTFGDELYLPVTVRNYLEQPQAVAVTMKPEPWFKLLGDDSQQLSVPAGDSTNAVFGFRATSFIAQGKQRVTAANRSLGDAVEKTVLVHPDGREDATYATRVLSEQDAFDYDLPSGIIPASLHAEMKLYPNPVAHAVEAIEAGLHRPYGCGEQTISSTYPSLLVVEYLRKHRNEDPIIAARAHRYLEAGYKRLLNYRSDDGGFTYWGHGEPDPALTAYAIRFLREAKDYVAVDDTIVPEAEDWLVKHAKEEEWDAYRGSRYSLTAYIALTLSEASDKEKNHAAVTPLVARALAHLGAVAEEYQDPYEIANVGLLSLRLHNQAGAERAAAQLRAKAITEGSTSHWELAQNTPFYGWGHAGAVETTALVVRFLHELNSNEPGDQQLMQRGLLYLIANKDRYGVWYSGQATQQVLRAMIEFAGGSDTAGTYTVEVNGKPATQIAVAKGQVAPSLVDVAKYLENGRNHVTLRSTRSTAATMQLASDYYVPWTTETNDAKRTGDLRGLKLHVDFDKQEARVAETIRCTVHAERFGSRGWGMMLAEIGLPPGVDVDRQSLEAVMQKANGLERYDVLPDRVVLYLWPNAGGSDLSFTFRPRMAMRAMSGQSQLYDYYNPEEQVIVAPARFNVQPQPASQVALAK